MICEFGLQFKVQRVARFLIPAKPVRGECASIGNGILQIKSSIGIHCQLVRTLEDFEYGFYPPQVLRKRCSTDLDLHRRISEIKIPLHLILQGRQVFVRIVVTARRVDEYFVVEDSSPKTVREQPEKRQP